MLSVLSSVASYRHVIQSAPPTNNANGWSSNIIPGDSALKVKYTFDNTVVDSSGYGYDGTALNSCFSNGQSKFATYSLKGDGLSNNREGGGEPAFLTPNNIPYTTANGTSFTMWIYPQYSNFNHMIIEFGIDSYLMFTSSYQLRYGTGTSSYTSSLTANEWHFLVITVASNGAYTIHVDNVLLKSETKATCVINNLNACSLLDGITRTGHNNTPSYISELHVYNSIITSHANWTGV